MTPCSFFAASLTRHWLVLILGGWLALAATAAGKPNIIFILADDLGPGDLGAYGQSRIKTPALDALAREGLKLTVHYSGNAVCAPSRCVLMTGKHPGHAEIRDNGEVKALGLPFPEGQAPLPAATVTLPKLLRELGYATGTFGKWGLGPVGSSGEPSQQGVDRFFGYNCQAKAHNHYPVKLWDNNTHIDLPNPEFSAYQRLPDSADVNDPASYAGYTGQVYAPDLIAEKAREFIRDHRDRPFFLFFATTIPHLALQVPEDSLQEYEGAFPETPYPGGRGYLPHRTPRAAYAAMITRMDREVGRLVALVRELGLEETTLFVFSSDNGPLYDRLGGTDDDFFNSALGRRGRKGSLYEGGVRVPCLVRWKGTIAPGTESTRVTGFEDWLPTLLELAGAADRIPADTDGISFAPTLLGKAQEPRPFLYREHAGYGGQQSVRFGDWKAVRERINLKGRRAETEQPGELELYNLAEDPEEKTNLAARHPDLADKASALIRKQHVKSDLFPLRAVDQ